MKNNLFFMKFKSYSFVFIGKISEKHILINEKSNRKILGFFKIPTKMEPGFRELNPNWDQRFLNKNSIQKTQFEHGHVHIRIPGYLFTFVKKIIAYAIQ